MEAVTSPPAQWLELTVNPVSTASITIPTPLTKIHLDLRTPDLVKWESTAGTAEGQASMAALYAYGVVGQGSAHLCHPTCQYLNLTS